MNTILHTEKKSLSPELTIVWYWFDMSHQLPGYRFGVDENFPKCGTYFNGKLVSTVYWTNSISFETVQRYLDTTPDNQKIYGVIQIPESI